MKVTLLSYTPDALTLLLRTKGTRLAHSGDPATWSDAQREEHLAYMKDTIKSSWEFVEYVFLIEGVTRAFTHQLVRTRTGSYAQESQRTVDVRDHSVLGPNLEGHPYSNDLAQMWAAAVLKCKDVYTEMVDKKVPVQEARGILPTNMTTSIVCKFDLRTLHNMAKVRLCTRTQGEYQDAFRFMRQRVIETHPWVEQHQFLEVECVSTGTCAFPRFGKTSCKFYDPAMDLDAHKARYHKMFWTTDKQVAVPVARDGKTM